MIGKYERTDINTYLEKYLKGKLGGFPALNGIKFESRDCEATHQSIIDAEKRSADDDELFRELMEEQRRELEEKEREEKEKKKKKKKKKGKKNVDGDL